MENVKGKEEKTDEKCDKCGSPMVIKWGRYGKFLACSNYPECKNTRQLEGGEGAPEVHEDVAKEVCPNHAQPMVLKKGRFGPFLACPNYPGVQGHQAAGARRGRQAPGGGPQAHRRELPGVRQAAHLAPRPLRAVHRLQRLPQLQIHQEEGSARDRPAVPGVRTGAGGRAQGPLGPGVLRLPPLPRLQVHRLPSPARRSPARTAGAPTCWRRRPRRKARSSSAATRPATTSAPPDACFDGRAAHAAPGRQGPRRPPRRRRLSAS